MFSPLKNEFDIHSLTGVYLIFSNINVNICAGLPDHTSDNRKTLKKAMKIKKRNPKKMPKILSTSNIQKGVSKCMVPQGSQIYDRRCLVLSEAVFKKIFSLLRSPSTNRMLSWQISIKIIAQLKSFIRSSRHTPRGRLS